MNEDKLINAGNARNELIKQWEKVLNENKMDKQI